MTKKQTKMITFAMVLANVMAGLDSTIINTAIPAIIADLNGIQFMGWIIAILLLGMSISIPIWTKVGEKIGNKLAFELSALFFVLGSLFQGLATNMYFFLFARALMGIGAGGLGSLPYIMAGFIFTNIKDRTKILGYLGAAFSVAAIIGPLAGGYLVDTLSWHWVFYINIPIGLGVILLSVIYYREKRIKSAARFDFLGAFLIVASLISSLLGIQLLGLISGFIVASLIVVGLILLVLFFKHEATHPNPVVPISMFKNRALVGDFLLFIFSWGAFLAINTYLPMWAQGLLGTTALIGGMTLIPNSLVDIVGTLVVNPLKERFSTRNLIYMGIICMLISSLGLAIAPSDTNIWWLAIIGTFSGFGVGFIFVLLQIKVQIDASEKNMAPATSLSYLIRILAQTIMAAVYGVIMNMALAAGVQNHHAITMDMMNKLSDARSAKSLPQYLLPSMRHIFHNGLQEIMLCSTALLLITLVLNAIYNKKRSK
ncbi:MFS transporter [uncultured Lactobacillus sp.]|uniref:MFS transporter n=1 Tax=uncultured Lactobacillus sp. TaxID=153152 RepID=UPI00260AF60A|nr:MFS transporter [uncultured Lactobacillus sp.]